MALRNTQFYCPCTNHKPRQQREREEAARAQEREAKTAQFKAGLARAKRRVQFDNCQNRKQDDGTK